MIVKINPSGVSFKGLATYLTHDPGSDTAARVAWTHTLNCVFDDVPSAVDQMLWTSRGAALLKEEAGIRAGGREVDRTVKHVSLNWHPSQEPTREQMVAAVESYLNHMGWASHEAVLVAHDDKEHSHVHVMINRINPQDGTALDDGFDKRRSQEWALTYERENGHIFCEQRLLAEAERDKAPTREAWEILNEAAPEFEKSENARRKFDADYMAREDNRRIIEGEEWQLLKDHQREVRETFFLKGKDEFKAIRNQAYRDVREIFREEWAAYYEAKKNPDNRPEDFRTVREDILERQRETLAEYRDEYSRLLREERDQVYRDLLDGQRDERAGLRERQEQGLRSPQLLDYAGDRWEEPVSIRDQFGRAADEITGLVHQRTADVDDAYDAPRFEMPGMTAAENPRVRDGVNAAADIGGGLIGAIGNIGEKLFDGFFAGDAPQARPEPVVAPPPPSRKEHWERVNDNPFLRVAEESRREAVRQEDAERRRAWWDDRDRGRE